MPPRQFTTAVAIRTAGRVESYHSEIPLRHTLVTLITILSLLPAMPLAAQDRYLEPPAAIARILDASMTPAVSVSPTRDWLLLMERPSLPGITEVAAPDLRLAGIRLDPRANGPSRAPGYTGLVLREIHGAVERRIQTPVGRLGNVQWSPDGKSLAFSVTSSEGIGLWVADVATGATMSLLGPVVNGAAGSLCRPLRFLRNGFVDSFLIHSGRHGHL